MNFWYQSLKLWHWILYPFSLLLLIISKMRRFLYQKGILKSSKNSLPVIVVGNISVGGNGKTPFVIWLCELLIQQGYKPGIISRGYGGKSAVYPLLVNATVNALQAGDEPVMLFKRLAIPIVVDPKRVNAAAYLSEHCDVDIIVTDDGLQHYALQRDLEIVIVDGKRRFGNQKMLPMGPLREPLSRLQEVDFIINNGAEKEGEISMLFHPESCQRVDAVVADLAPESEVNACAAIGYPQRFFATLEKQKFKLHKTVSFADHHAFCASDFSQFESQKPLLMTEKDALKCTEFALENWWYLPINARLPATFEILLLQKIREIK